ncbi:hypothetical protein LZ30DRAFT_476709 [Colletotrichum cereale]|nr:hypothetical protein LZ30DRAFT_476709 [Colletotrichum cereale]
MYEDKTLMAQTMGVTETLSKHDLCDTEPVWPNLMDFRTKVEMTVLSIRLLTRTPTPLWTGVLYHIARRDYPNMPAWPEVDKFLGVHGAELLGFLVTGDLKAADILVKYSTMSDGERFHIWMELLGKVGRVTDFWLRYGERSYNWRKRQDTNYISDIARSHFGLPPNSRQDPFGIPRESTPSKSEASCDDQGTQEMVRQVRMMGNMRHVRGTRDPRPDRRDHDQEGVHSELLQAGLEGSFFLWETKVGDAKRGSPELTGGWCREMCRKARYRWAS